MHGFVPPFLRGYCIINEIIVQINQFSSTQDGRKPYLDWLLSVDSILASLVMRFYVCQMLVCCYYLNDQELIRWCMNISMPRTKATFQNLEPNRNLFPALAYIFTVSSTFHPSSDTSSSHETFILSWFNNTFITKFRNHPSESHHEYIFKQKSWTELGICKLLAG